MKNILVISNNSVSNSESNGRIHTNLIREYIPNHLFNFYFRGIPDVEGVKYIACSPKSALLSKISFGLIKPNMITVSNVNPLNSETAKSNPKSKYIFFHLLRSFAFLRNRSILKELSNYVERNNIEGIMLWGCNIPFLYRYADILSKKKNIKLVIFTCEDYPLKKYNYINKTKLIYKILQKSLYKQCKKAYLNSSLNIYNSEPLKEAYEKQFKLNGGVIRYFPSTMKKCKACNASDSFSILYAGNLCRDRIASLLDVAEVCKDYKNIVINIYGNADNDSINLFKSFPNIHFYGFIPYEELVGKIENANLLIHVEGFSKEYINDCRYAFSTKIADYYMSSLPFFMYGPKEIAGISFAYNLNSKWTATDKDELRSKLIDIIEQRTSWEINEKINDLFSIDTLKFNFPIF